MNRALFVVLALPGCIIATDRTMTFDNVDGIVVEFSNGDVDVTGVEGNTTTVDLDMGGITFDNVSHTVRDGVLMLLLDCGLTCGGDVIISAPAGVWVDVELNNGDVGVHDMSGDVVATLGSGDLTVSGLTSPYVCLGTGAGSIDVGMDVAATSLVVDVGAGDAMIRVPGGGYNLDVDAGVGSIELDGVWHEPGSNYMISARAGAGSLEIWGL